MSLAKKFLPLVLFVVGLSFAALPVSAATLIDVPNGSFELPTTTYATADIDNWQKAPMPSWWPSTGFNADAWNTTTGVFLNALDPQYYIDNVDGKQAAFLFATPGVELFQDLAATYQAGEAYHLTVAMEGGGGMLIGVPIDLRLYYRDDAGDRITIGSTTVTNTNTGVISHLTDYQLDIPAVTAGDVWAGRSIGVQVISTADFSNYGGYWDLDNVRLTATPEPATLALLVLGGAVLLARRRRG